MAIDLLLLCLSIIILLIGAEAMVRGASRLALRLGISAFVVGVTVVGFGTSAPELAASLTSVTSGHPEIALGNVIGSNIMNIALVLGISAIVLPIPVRKNVVRKETLIVIGVAFLPYLAFLSGGRLERWMGILFVIMLIAFLYYTWRSSRDEGGTPEEEEIERVKPKAGLASMTSELVLVCGGIALLVLGANVLVSSASNVARTMGVSELVIGLTIVAGGTSAPELVTSLVATFRGNADLGVGNILGSCVFNILGILGITIVVVPIEVPASVFAFDLPVMITLSVACLPIFFTGKGISRWEGVLLLAGWLIYTVLLYVGWPASQEDDRTAASIQPPPSTMRSS